MARYGPIVIPGHEDELPLASNKAAYTNVFFHGDNLEEGIASSFTSETDNFARQGYLIRLPKVVRLLFSGGGGTPATAFTNHYNQLAQDLADALAPSGICVAWGRTGGTNDQWLFDATPDAAESHAIADLVVGDVFTYHFVGLSITYGNDLNDYVIMNSAAQLYEADYDRFSARHGKFESFGGHVYQTGPTGGDDIDEIVTRAMSGASPFDQFGPGLSTMGWTSTIVEWDLPANYVTLATIQAEVEAFFGL